jgi:hypothetical protein
LGVSQDGELKNTIKTFSGSKNLTNLKKLYLPATYVTPFFFFLPPLGSDRLRPFWLAWAKTQQAILDVAG